MRSLLRVAVVLGLVCSVLASASGGAAGEETGGVWTERRVLNIAHAGGDLEQPHSTLFAMKTAVAAGTDVLELDLRLSADSVLMVHHDATLDRTANASGPIRDLTAAELHDLDNAYWFAPDCWSCRDLPADAYVYRGIRTGDRPPPAGFAPTDFTIPTLAEVVATFPDRILDVEIKDGPDGIATAEALAAFIGEHGPADRWVVASFDETLMAHFKALAPEIATSPSLGEMVRWLLTGGGPLEGHQILQVPPTYQGFDVVNETFLEFARSQGIAVWVWFSGTGTDNEAEWQRLIDLGVDGLLTGKPAAAEAVIEANSVGYTVAPTMEDRGSLARRQVKVDIGCPAAHVDTCSSHAILVSRDRHGRLMLLGTARVDVTRGTTQHEEISLVPGARRRLPRGPVTAYALMFAADLDTAPAILPVELTRR